MSYESITSPLSSILISGDSRIFIRAHFTCGCGGTGRSISFMTSRAAFYPIPMQQPEKKLMRILVCSPNNGVAIGNALSALSVLKETSFS